MRIRLIAVGEKMPTWVQSGFQQYARRISNSLNFSLLEINAPKRGKNADIQRLKRDEGQKMLAAIPSASQVVALEVKGKPWSTAELARQLQTWMDNGRDIDLLIGGADGLSSECLQRADQRWSLSALTLPHPLARILVAEQLYRAHSILRGHPYHRG